MDETKKQLQIEGDVTKNAPVYGYWAALYKSFYSGSLYLDVGKRWPGFGLLYLLFVIALFFIPMTIKIGFVFNEYFDEQMIKPLSQLPTIYVQNGEAFFDKPTPYLVRNKKNQVVLLADPNGSMEKWSLQYPYLSIFINKNAIFVKVPSPQWLGPQVTLKPSASDAPISQFFDKNSNFVLSGSQIINQNHIQGIKHSADFMLYPMFIAMLYSLAVVLFLVLAFFGQIFAQLFFSFTLSFKESCRLFMVAATPMLFLFAVLLPMDLVFTGMAYVLLVLAMIYFSIGIHFLKANTLRYKPLQKQ